MCEKCWGDAFRRAMNDPIKSQAEQYELLLAERNKVGPICSPKEQAGQFWDEEKERDTRES